MSTTIEITGNTYPHRISFRAMGGKWDGAKKAWVLPAEKAGEALALMKAPVNTAARYDAASAMEGPHATMAIAKAAFPGWRGRKLRTEQRESVTLLGTYWSGGSKNTFVAVELATLRTSPADRRLGDPNAFGGIGDSHPTIRIPPGYAIVEHVIFRGKDLGCRVYTAIEGGSR